MNTSAALQVGPHQATIELFEDRAPRTIAEIRQLLPLDVPLSHAKFAGDELMFMIPLVLEPEWLKQTIETADVFYYPIQQTVCLFFGRQIVPFGAGPFNAIGRISGGLADLTTIAESIRREGFQKARLIPTGKVKGIKRSPISKLTAEIVAEREKIWLDAPAELETLKQTQKGLAGKYSVRFYAVGDTYRNQRNIWQIRSLLREGRLDPATARLLLSPLLREAAGRFEIWSLHSPSRLFRKAEKALDAVTSAIEIIPLLDELLIYNNRWWLWLDSTIPWFDLDKKLK